MAEYGLDLSSHNGLVDFDKVKAAGNSFVILRAGFGWSPAQKDPYFDAYYQAAKETGLKVGAYHYSYARTLDEAEAEAECFLGWIAGKDLEMPVWIDMEDADGWKHTNGNPSGAMQAQICNTFMHILEIHGYTCGVYSSASWFDNYLVGLKSGCLKWIASWGNDDGYVHGHYGPLHQYTSRYVIAGKRYDRNVAYQNLSRKDEYRPATTFNAKKWMDNHMGQFLNPDAVADYQCVDVFKQLALDIGMPDGARALEADGFAHQIWYRRHELGYLKYFDEIQPSQIQVGDVIVFAKCAQCPDSHVAMVYGFEGDRIQCFGQNQGGKAIAGTLGSACNVITLSRDGLLGGLRVKSAKPAPEPLDRKPERYVYRLYNSTTGDHLYTVNYAEAKAIVEAGWLAEDGWQSPAKGIDVYRLYNGQQHTYGFKAEADVLVKQGWSIEGIAFKSSGSKPIYRLYNPNAGTHLLSIDRKEHNALSATGWYCEGQEMRAE